VAIVLEVCEGVCQILQCLCLSKKSSSITPLVSFDHYQSLHPRGFQLLWTITDLPPFNSYDSILVVVDHLTKMVHFISCTKTITNKGTTKLFFDHVFQYHGLPKGIILNCEPQIASKFWK
jgi:hypothetical protein